MYLNIGLNCFYIKNTLLIPLRKLIVLVKKIFKIYYLNFGFKRNLYVKNHYKNILDIPISDPIYDDF